MHEESIELVTPPFQIPTLEAAQRQIEILEIKAVEKTELEDQLLAMENEANEIRVQLGKEPLEPTIKRFSFMLDPEAKELRAQREVRLRDECLELAESLDLGDEVPVFFRRQHYVDLDLAGGYTINTSFAVQKSRDLLFIEETVSTEGRSSNPRTSQYVIGRGLKAPLRVETHPHAIAPTRLFMLDHTELYHWDGLQGTLKDVKSGLETEKLKQDTLDILANQPLEESKRLIGDLVKSRIVRVNENQSIEVVAGYYSGQCEAWLAHLALIDVVDGEVARTNRLDVREGTFDDRSFRYPENEEAMDSYRLTLGIVKALVAGQIN